MSRYIKTVQLPPRYPGQASETGTDFNVMLATRDSIIVIVALIILAICWPFNSVPTGSRGVVTQFGRIIGIEPEGLVVLPPWQKLSIFSIRSEVATIENASGATSDIQPSEINTALSDKLSVYGAHVISIDMRNFEFTPQYWAATNQKTVQEQLKLAADNKLKTVESEQKQKVAIAEAEASAVRAQADGDSYALLKNATAQADALKVQNAALAQNKDVLELRRIEVEQTKANRWNGQLPQSIYAGAPIPFMNIGSK